MWSQIQRTKVLERTTVTNNFSIAIKRAAKIYLLAFWRKKNKQNPTEFLLDAKCCIFVIILIRLKKVKCVIIK